MSLSGRRRADRVGAASGVTERLPLARKELVQTFTGKVLVAHAEFAAAPTLADLMDQRRRPLRQETRGTERCYRNEQLAIERASIEPLDELQPARDHLVV